MNAAGLHASLVAAAPTDPDSPIYGELEFGGDVFTNPDASAVRVALGEIESGRIWNHVLEIGPGGGRWAKWFALQCQRYTGVDATDRAWDHLARLPQFDRDRPPTLLISKDGRLPTYLGAAYHRACDLVFAYDTHVHFGRELFDRSLAAMCDAVSPGGLLVIHHATQEGKQPHQPATQPGYWHDVPAADVDRVLTQRGFAAAWQRTLSAGFGSRVGIYRRIMTHGGVQA